LTLRFLNCAGLRGDEEKQMGYEVTVTVTVPDVEGESEDDAINFVTEAIEDSFVQRVDFRDQRAANYSD
jgi:hypothetical protein